MRSFIFMRLCFVGALSLAGQWMIMAFLRLDCFPKRPRWIAERSAATPNMTNSKFEASTTVIVEVHMDFFIPSSFI